MILELAHNNCSMIIVLLTFADRVKGSNMLAAQIFFVPNAIV